MAPKSNFLDKVLGRIGRLDSEGLQTVVQRLARERSFLETLFNTIEDGILVLDETGKVLYINSAVYSILGLHQGNIEGQAISRILPELDWERLMAMDSEGGAKVMRQEFELHFPRQRFMHLYAAPLDGENSGSAGVALILHDATEAKKKTVEAIESERVQALTLLAASVAHEIGNPLNALHIHLQLMERELKKLRRAVGEGTALSEPEGLCMNAAGRLENYLNVAKGEIGRLDYIVTQFLDALRPRAPRFVAGTLNEVVRETLNLLRPEIENRGQKIIEKLAPKLPAAMYDPAQIKQVLVNLIKNAMQAMTRGGELTIQTGASAEAVFVSVSDTGPGIPQEQLNKIFEAFYTTKKKGSGLGLMIVQRIVRDHGGRIDLESHPGKGTTFRVWLQLQERAPRLLHAGDAAAEITEQK